MKRRNIIIASITALLTFGSLATLKAGHMHHRMAHYQSMEDGNHYNHCFWGEDVNGDTEAITE